LQKLAEHLNVVDILKQKISEIYFFRSQKTAQRGFFLLLAAAVLIVFSKKDEILQVFLYYSLCVVVLDPLVSTKRDLEDSIFW